MLLKLSCLNEDPQLDKKQLSLIFPFCMDVDMNHEAILLTPNCTNGHGVFMVHF